MRMPVLENRLDDMVHMARLHIQSYMVFRCPRVKVSFGVTLHMLSSHSCLPSTSERGAGCPTKTHFPSLTCHLNLTSQTSIHRHSESSPSKPTHHGHKAKSIRGLRPARSRRHAPTHTRRPRRRPATRCERPAGRDGPPLPRALRPRPGLCRPGTPRSRLRRRVSCALPSLPSSSPVR